MWGTAQLTDRWLTGDLWLLVWGLVTHPISTMTTPAPFASKLQFRNRQAMSQRPSPFIVQSVFRASVSFSCLFVKSLQEGTEAWGNSASDGSQETRSWIVTGLFVPCERAHTGSQVKIHLIFYTYETIFHFFQIPHCAFKTISSSETAIFLKTLAAPRKDNLCLQLSFCTVEIGALNWAWPLCHSLLNFLLLCLTSWTHWRV